MAFDDRHSEILIAVFIFGIGTAIGVPSAMHRGYSPWFGLLGGAGLLLIVVIALRVISYFADRM